MKVVPERIKIVLTCNNVQLDVTNDIVEWESLEMLQERDGVSGVINSVTFPVKLRGQGMTLLKASFDELLLYSSGSISIYERENFGENYALLKSAPLDFSTYSETSEYVEIECSESELSNIINSEGKTKYDILVTDVKEEKQWKYNRMVLRNTGVFTVATETPFLTENKPVDYPYIQFPVSMSKSEIVPGSADVDFRDQSYQYNDITEYLAKSYDKDLQVYVDFDFNVSVKIKIRSSLGLNEVGQLVLNINCVRLELVKYDEDDYVTILESILIPTAGDVKELSSGYYSRDFSANIHLRPIFFYTLDKNSRMVLRMFANCRPYLFELTIPEFNKFEVYFYHSSSEHVTLDVIRPTKLLQKYLDLMAGEDMFKGFIEWEDEPAEVMILAAESVRGFDNANIHGSPNDFFDWLKVLGYEPDIDGETITFKKRDKVFLSDVVGMELTSGEVSDLIVKADSEHAYTSIEIGYNKEDYDNINGRSEVNGKFSYTTGYVSREDNKLQLISPYRSDSIGIEFLCKERGEVTTDKKDDNDIFFVALVDEGKSYKEYKDIYIRDRGTNVELFNAIFCPYYLVKRNANLIGINSKILKFKSTDMNREAIIMGEDVDMYADVEIVERLFAPVIYDFAAGHHKDLPENKNGLVCFDWQGETKKGYIKSIRKNYATEEETTWELHAFLS